MKRSTILLTNNRGSALVITLLVIATLTALVLLSSEESDLELNLAAFSRDGNLAAQAARSGISIGLFLLDRDDNREMDSLNEDWGKFSAEFFPEGLFKNASLTGRIIDESTKINVNLLRNNESEIAEKNVQRLKRLFKSLGLEENLAEPLLDWLDGDSIERMNGAENSYYNSLEKPYPCGNGPFQSIGQITLVKGLGDIKIDITDFLTIYSDGLVNINTAPVEVIQSLDDEMDTYLAEAIIQYRKERDFGQINDLKNVPGIDEELIKRISPFITVKSSCFSLHMKGTCNGAVREIKAIALRDSDGIRIIYWKVI